ncbi:MAG: NUDIX hydrolase [Candidatus Methanomethylophilaceae archaeon]
MDGKVLMLKRPAACHSFPGKWSLVAGKIEPGETPIEAAKREILEETSILVGGPDAVVRPFYVREGNILWKVNGMLFRVSFANPHINEENEAFQWVPVEEISELDTVTDTMSVVEKLIK